MLRRLWLGLAVCLLGGTLATAGPILFTAASTDGENYALAALNTDGTYEKRVELGQGFNGGLAYHPTRQVFYAIGNDEFGASKLYSIDWSGHVTSLFGLGTGFYGGLAWAGGDQFSAIAGDRDGIQRSLFTIDVDKQTAELVTDLGDGSSAFDGGLTWYDGKLFLLGNDGVSNSLYSYDPLSLERNYEGILRGSFFPGAGGLARNPDADGWWALGLDADTYQPRLYQLTDATGGRIDFETGMAGLTWADDPTSVPEPATLALLGAGLLSLGWLRRRRAAAGGTR